MGVILLLHQITVGKEDLPSVKSCGFQTLVLESIVLTDASNGITSLCEICVML